MRHCNVLVSFRAFLKISLHLLFMIAVGNALHSLIFPEIGVSISKEYGAEFPSMTLCANNLDYDNSINSFETLLSKTHPVEDLFQISIRFGDRNKTIVNLSDSTEVRKYFQVESLISENFRCMKKTHFVAFRCAIIHTPNQIVKTASKYRPSVIFKATEMGQKLVKLITVHYHGYMQSVISDFFTDWDNVQYFALDTERTLKIVDLSAEKVRKISRRDRYCDPTNSTFLATCLNEFVKASLNCSLPWQKRKDDYKVCSTHEEFSKFRELMVDFPQDVCTVQNCGVINTKFRVLVEKRTTDNLTQIEYYMNDNEVTVMKEIVLYGFFNFVSDFGGFLGLLLGASMLSLFDDIVLFLSSRKASSNFLDHSLNSA